MQEPDTPVAIHPAAPADIAAVGRLGALLVRLHHDFDPQRFLAATPDTERAYAACTLFPSTTSSTMEFQTVNPILSALSISASPAWSPIMARIGDKKFKNVSDIFRGCGAWW
jgi:hypothetical protein